MIDNILSRLGMAILLLGCQNLCAQDIELYNPSWEDEAHAGTTGDQIIGWNDCGFASETPPDIHDGGNAISLPDSLIYMSHQLGIYLGRFFDVSQKASDGNTYLGMVARDNDTYESISQWLASPLIPGRCYSFSLDLCRSAIYNSKSQGSDEMKSFTKPIVLRIYGSNSKCGRSELLGESEAVRNSNWHSYSFKFEPKDAYRYIVLQAFYKLPILEAYNGNLLLDNASIITMIDCDDNIPIAMMETQEEVKVNKKPKKKNKDTNKKPTAKTKIKKEKPKESKPFIATSKEKTIIPELEAPVKVNQVIKIESLYFEEDRASIIDTSYYALNEVYNFLRSNDNVAVEVGGHTNGLCADEYCNKLSRKRARAVWLYLAHKGISTNRIKYKGYGKDKPIANNDTAAGRQKNQRVEIKILSVNG